ncbi:hypothetical protein COV61_03345 [Candidatus Micrarchaeota archaeon CG11_big_fil_rev_8_21_14_0_20_47_5]|nr:MAG: hypothetical protein AUJ17_03340 [Candidatus Micrarchaeota archaeon CG1_02_47_40]PIN83348.1 MAG: hypothetical protein COV61_03345 [Candidatus Micrarchaeota archaeon CG11_big_fil_rev_8_21_14_0_20_47_5]
MAMRAASIVKNAIRLYVNNMPAVVWATMLYLVSFTVALGAGIALALIFFLLFSAFEMEPIFFFPVMSIICVGVMLGFIFISAGLKAAYYQMCHAASRGGAGSILGFIEYSSRKAKTAFFIEAVQYLILAIGIFLAFSFSLVVEGKILPLMLYSFFILLSCAANLIFAFSLPSIVMDGTNAIASVRRSISSIRENILRFSLVILILLVISSAVSFVPFFGPIILLLFALPVCVISMFLFYAQIRIL